MKTLKVNDVPPASYETFADVAERLSKSIREVHSTKATAFCPLGIGRRQRLKHSIRPAGA
jgi:hypothetical protein